MMNRQRFRQTEGFGETPIDSRSGRDRDAGAPWRRGTEPRLLGAALLGLSILLPGGCVTSPDGCIRPMGDQSLTPEVAAVRGNAIGQTLTWGGTLVDTRNLRDATELEVLAFPLDACGRPLTGEEPLGRFIVRRPGYLETADLKPGREVTANGPVVATSEGRIGGAEHRFPVLEDREPHVWPKPAHIVPSAVRPWISIGVGGGGGWSGGGVGVVF
jgi:outer membrane lipoprotein